MNPEEVQIEADKIRRELEIDTAIIRALGFSPELEHEEVPSRDPDGGHTVAVTVWKGPNGAFHYNRPPRYSADLNAMHAAEATLKPVDVPHYSRELIEVTRASVALANGETWLNTYAMYHATAAKRAEAFLRTIGKWIDEPCTPTS